MAHFAQIDPNGIVVRVIVVNNSDIIDANGNESEEIGKQFCANLLGGSWVQTSYNSNFRKHYAGTGYTYDSQRNAFIPLKPYSSWILDEETCNWNAPLPQPEGDWYWDEESLSWKEIINDPN
jgi:hypothetical protein